LSKAIRGLVLLLVFYPLRWMVRCLSWRQALGVGTLLGTLHALFIKDQLHRQIHQGCKTVLRHELPEAAIKRLVRRNLVTRYKHVIDSFFYRCLDEALIERLVPTVEGRSHLDHALAAGKGVILLASHFGSPGMLIAGLVFRGYRVHQVFTLTPQPHYRTWRRLERATMQAKLRCWEHERVSFEFWRPGMYLRPLYRKLLEGAIVVLYGDAARGRQFTRVEFMGYPLMLSVGPLRIAARAQVALIPAFITRTVDDGHRIILEEPIMLKDDDPSSLQQGANQYASLLSHYVRTYPDQWFTWARLRRVAGEVDSALELSTGEVDPANFYAYGKRQQA
jgi:lauroyl/myristoyl acyltransferase